MQRDRPLAFGIDKRASRDYFRRRARASIVQPSKYGEANSSAPPFAVRTVSATEVYPIDNDNLNNILELQVPLPEVPHASPNQSGPAGLPGPVGATESKSAYR